MFILKLKISNKIIHMVYFSITKELRFFFLGHLVVLWEKSLAELERLEVLLFVVKFIQ